MSANARVQELASREYQYGFVLDLNADREQPERATIRSATRRYSATLAERTRSRTSRCETIRHKSSTRRPPRRFARTGSFTLSAEGHPPEDAVSMTVNGFCREVLKELPMEFAVEAQKLWA